MNQQIFPIIIVISKVIFFFRTIALVDITKLSPWLEEVAVVVCVGGGGGGGVMIFFFMVSEGLKVYSSWVLRITFCSTLVTRPKNISV